jgi:hypothetical protein
MMTFEIESVCTVGVACPAPVPVLDDDDDGSMIERKEKKLQSVEAGWQRRSSGCEFGWLDKVGNRGG